MQHEPFLLTTLYNILKFLFFYCLSRQLAALQSGPLQFDQTTH